MPTFYDPNTNGFYSDEIHSEIPAGSIEITTNKHQELLAGLAKGMMIVVEDDQVKLQTQKANLTWTEIRIRRDILLARSDWTGLADVDLSPEKLNEWRAYRKALRDIPQTSKDPNKIRWPKVPS